MTDPDEDLYRVPEMVVDQALAGYWAAKNRTQEIGRGFSTIEEAKRAVAQVCEPIEWVEMVRDKYGNPLLLGAHPEMVAHMERHKRPFRVASPERDIEGAELRLKLGDATWYDQYYIEPEYKDVYGPVEGAERVINGSNYYIAPTWNGYWGVFNTLRSAYPNSIETYSSKEEAKANGLKLHHSEAAERYLKLADSYAHSRIPAQRSASNYLRNAAIGFAILLFGFILINS